MNKRLTFILLALGLSAVFIDSAYAEIRIALRDQNNLPISDAVLSIASHAALDTSTTVIVDQVDKQFLPRVAIVYQGQRVHFPNSDDVRHHVYSFSKAKPFELKLYSGNATEPLLFDSSGVVVLGCNIHDRMVGYIYVASGGTAAKTDAQGSVSLDVKSEAFDIDTDTVMIWHPRLSLQPETQIERSLPKVMTNGVYVLRVDLQPEPEPEAEKKSGFRSRFN